MSCKVNVTFGGFVPTLTILFIALKLCGQINWSWLWVLSPLWISFAVAIVCGLLYVLLDRSGF